MDYIANITPDLYKRFSEVSQGLSFSTFSDGRGEFWFLKICPLFNQHSLLSSVLQNIHKRKDGFQSSYVSKIFCGLFDILPLE